MSFLTKFDHCGDSIDGEAPGQYSLAGLNTGAFVNKRHYIECEVCRSDDIVHGAEVCKYCGADIDYYNEGTKVAKTWAVTASILTLTVGGVVCGGLMEMPVALLVPFLSTLTGLVGFLTFKKISESVGNREIIRFSKKKSGTSGFAGVSVPFDPS